MFKTHFQLKGIFPGKNEKDVHALDLNEGTFKYHEFYYSEEKSKGKIWIDGKRILPNHAMIVRSGFSDKSLNFTWGYESHSTRITSLAICLYLFKDKEKALNIYIPFMRTFLTGFNIASFEKPIDLTDFLIDHRELLSGNCFTRYFDFSFLGNHEIKFEYDPVKRKYGAKLLEQVCDDNVRDKEKWAVRPSLRSLLTGKKEATTFDWQHEYEKEYLQLQRFFFKKRKSVVSEKSLELAIQTTQSILSEHYEKKREYLRKKGATYIKTYGKLANKFKH